MTGLCPPPASRRVPRAAVAVALVLVVGVLAPYAETQAAAATTQTVTYRGIRIRVPASWPVYDLGPEPGRCVLFNRNGLYLGVESPDAACPASAMGVADAAQLQPPTSTAPARGSAVDDTTARRVEATSANGAVEASISYLNHDTMLTALLTQLGVARVVTEAHGPLPERGATAGGATTGGATTGGATVGPRPLVPAPAGPGPAPRAQVPRVQVPNAQVPRATPGSTSLGFDTCGAPSVATMSTWHAASPYTTVGIYLGGVNRACPSGNLSAAWVTAVAEQGWAFIPTYVGVQAPCVDQSGLATIDPTMAAAEGTSAADDAVSDAFGLGMRAGTPIYFDSEAYNNTVAGCTQTVLAFLSAWTTELQAHNYVAGVYGSSSSTMSDLVGAATAGGVALPDDVWVANWNGGLSLTDPAIPDGYWSENQRLHQYQGGHGETWGGVAVNVDDDVIGGATAIAGNGPPQSLQVFTTTTSGQVLTGWQYAPEHPFDPWQGLQVPATVAGSPIIGANQSGALQIFARANDNRIITSWQAGPSRSFGGWLDLGADGQLLSDPATALDGNGVGQVAVAASNGRVLISWQSQPNGPYGGWLDLGLPGRAAGAPMLATEADGAVQVFVRTSGNRLLTSWQPAPGHPFGGWLDLGLDGQITLGPTVAANAGGALSVFVQGTNGRILTSWQPGPDQPFGGWLTLGLPAAAGGVATATTQASGGLQLFVRTTDNRLLTSWQPAPGQPFGGWLDLGLAGAFASDASAALNADGTMAVFVRGAGGRLLTSWQPAPGQPFGGWLDLGLPATATATPEVAVNLRGA